VLLGGLGDGRNCVLGGILMRRVSLAEIADWSCKRRGDLSPEVELEAST
jgi:hypothetical protein